MAHTQGPWKEYDTVTSYPTPERGHLATDIWGPVRDGHTAIVARVYHCEDGSDANQKLIAAAPALLAALRAAQEAIAYTGASALPRDAGVDWQAVAEQVDVAIYRATNIGTQEVN